jgi:hypothetical protein
MCSGYSKGQCVTRDSNDSTDDGCIRDKMMEAELDHIAKTSSDHAADQENAPDQMSLRVLLAAEYFCICPSSW